MEVKFAFRRLPPLNINAGESDLTRPVIDKPTPPKDPFNNRVEKQFTDRAPKVPKLEFKPE